MGMIEKVREAWRELRDEERLGSAAGDRRGPQVIIVIATLLLAVQVWRLAGEIKQTIDMARDVPTHHRHSHWDGIEM